MTDREHLIQYLVEMHEKYGVNLVLYFTDEEAAIIADKLLAQGVIVPPVKVGDVVYCICGKDVEKVQITAITQYQNGMYFTGYSDTLLYQREIADIGKTVFLTEADAIKALKERDR